MKSRLRGRRRILTVASVVLALIGGVIAGPGAATAQPPTGTCTQTCNNPPGGVSQGDWDAALEAADFWANHHSTLTGVVFYRLQSYYVLTPTSRGGWPAASFGNRWYGYWEPGLRRNQYLYYGGTYNDFNGMVSGFEQQAHGGTTSNAYSTYRDRLGRTHRAPYVEYDIDYYGAPHSTRNARRIVRNSITGRTFVTYDHYQSFYYLGHF